MITTFVDDPAAGEVSRRTAYIRNNGLLGKLPSFTILSNHCAHLGCPVQPNGPVDTNKSTEQKDRAGNVIVKKTPVQPAGFGCPCHGGQYDTEGNRTAGPPVRALDRYTYSIVEGHLVLGGAYSVDYVKGTGKDAQIKKYPLHNPGQHVAGPEFWLWPIPQLRHERPLMPAKSERRQQMEGMVLYPLDWLEERSGLVGGLKYFLFRKVPGDTGWAQTLGSATLTAFLVQAITGVILAMFYKPDPERAPTRRSSTSRTTSRSAGSSAGCTAGAPASSSSCSSSTWRGSSCTAPTSTRAS